ncbi:MAG TPA: beta-ketoacyl-[acyl-carrier-protein] synthase family protein, partial [Clostridiales bacterium]|nr:beta-ketoacyl-[acyl-carrier-protein] synthase family protein [Clostridiales bacterium]
MKKKVVVTGVGAVTSIGDNSISFWENCLAGKSGISEVEIPNIELLKAKNAGQIKDFKLSNYH